MRSHQVSYHLALPLVLGKMGPGFVESAFVDLLNVGAQSARLVQNRRLKQIEDCHGTVWAELLALSGLCLQVAHQHSLVFSFQLSEKMGLDVLYLRNLDRSDALVHRLLHEVETGRATLLLILLEYVLKVGPNAPLNICRDLHQVFRVDDSAKLFA